MSWSVKNVAKVKRMVDRPESLEGKIVVFNPPLICYKNWPEQPDGWKSIAPPEGTESTECEAMIVEGGFGAHRACGGRMLIGRFFKTFEDAEQNINEWSSGNTKVYPSGWAEPGASQ